MIKLQQLKQCGAGEIVDQRNKYQVYKEINTIMLFPVERVLGHWLSTCTKKKN